MRPRSASGHPSRSAAFLRCPTPGRVTAHSAQCRPLHWIVRLVGPASRAGPTTAGGTRGAYMSFALDEDTRQSLAHMKAVVPACAGKRDRRRAEVFPRIRHEREPSRPPGRADPSSGQTGPADALLDYSSSSQPMP